jgi:biopolymer transport protein ExbB
MVLDLGHIWTAMSPINKVILFILLGMGILSVAVTVERVIAFARSARDSRRFASKVAPLIQEWRVDGIEELSKSHKHSNLARLFGAITRRYIDARDDQGSVNPVELAHNEAERRKGQIAADLRRGFSALATIGSIAPFVGLLGTVIGIIAAFQGIGAAGAGMSAVMNGNAEALIETAIGLMVAIPAVVMFNYLSARAGSIDTALARSAGELLDEVENNHARPVTKREGKSAAA